MSETLLVDLLGMLAGSVWLCAAIYFQMIRRKAVHPGFVGALSLIGIALILSSSTVALAAPGRIEIFAVVGNLVFIALGVVSSVALERHAANQERKDVEPINASAE
jgi:di/tricarboxylate transporter